MHGSPTQVAGGKTMIQCILGCCSPKRSQKGCRWHKYLRELEIQQHRGNWQTRVFIRPRRLYPVIGLVLCMQVVVRRWNAAEESLQELPDEDEVRHPQWWRACSCLVRGAEPGLQLAVRNVSINHRWHRDKQGVSVWGMPVSCQHGMGALPPCLLGPWSHGMLCRPI